MWLLPLENEERKEVLEGCKNQIQVGKVNYFERGHTSNNAHTRKVAIIQCTQNQSHKKLKILNNTFNMSYILQYFSCKQSLSELEQSYFAVLTTHYKKGGYY